MPHARYPIPGSPLSKCIWAGAIAIKSVHRYSVDFLDTDQNGKSINIFEDGRESRDFVFVEDAVAATMLGIQYEGWVNEVFNVGSGVPTDVNAIVRMLQAAREKSPTVVSGKFRLGDIRHTLPT